MINNFKLECHILKIEELQAFDTFGDLFIICNSLFLNKLDLNFFGLFASFTFLL